MSLGLTQAPATTPRAARQATPSIAASGSADVTVTWPTAFASANYTATVTVENADAGETLRATRIISRTPTQIVVRVTNSDALNPRMGTVHAVGIAD